MSRSSHSTTRTMPRDAHVLASIVKAFGMRALATETTQALLSRKSMPLSTIQSLRLKMCEMNEGMTIELTGANGDKWECLGTVVVVTSVDSKGWAIRQKETLKRDRYGDCSPFAHEYVWIDDDRPWYQAPGHSLSGLPLSSGKTFEGTDYE